MAAGRVQFRTLSAMQMKKEEEWATLAGLATRISMPSLRLRQPMRKLLVVVGTLALATALQTAFRSAMELVPFMLFHAATFTSAWYGGLWAGLGCASAGAVIGNVLFLKRIAGSSFSGDAIVATASFLAVGTVFSLLSESRLRALQFADEAIRLRETFLSVAGHELRGPMTALNLRLQILQRRPELAGSSDLESARRNVARMDVLIRELLDVARLQKGRLDLQKRPVELGDLARQVIARVSDESAQMATPIALEVEAPVQGQWDPDRIDQILTNLLLNALKYGQGKPISVRVGRRAAKVVISVADQGIGIAPADQKRIFERFERAVPEGSYDGIGLGLWIACEVARAHGGHIGVESEQGKGATFTVELPI
jgi:signal transduction histidine kinase